MAEWWSEDEFSEVPEGFEEEEGGGLAEEFASEPLYTYHTALDERVCPRCAPLEGVMFTLEEINEQFPSNENYEDIVFVNLHDRCRCQLTREQQLEEPGEEGEGEDMVEGRGEPLYGRGWIGRSTFSPSLVGLILHPSPRSFARFGIRGILSMLGLSSLIFPILAIAMPLLLPMINQLVRVQVKEEMEREIRRQLEAEFAKREAMMREVYRGVIPE